MNAANVKECPCCRQLRPFPTEPGEWEYREKGNKIWTRATIKLATGSEFSDCEPGNLLFYCHEIMNAIDFEDRHPGPHWWPVDAEWRAYIPHLHS